MPRAAPGDIANGAVRRRLPEYLQVPVSCLDRYWSKRPHRAGMETFFHPYESQAEKCGTFTQHLSGFRVERGCLGEVVSLVGDCRPPPPGNPHRPTIPAGTMHKSGEAQKKPAQLDLRGIRFTSIMQKLGGINFSIWMNVSFNIVEIPANLKNLNSSEYFKNKHSCTSCTENDPVLKFGSFRSHLCGLKIVEPPPIVITNVLVTRE